MKSVIYTCDNPTFPMTQTTKNGYSSLPELQTEPAAQNRLRFYTISQTLILIDEQHLQRAFKLHRRLREVPDDRGGPLNAGYLEENLRKRDYCNAIILLAAWHVGWTRCPRVRYNRQVLQGM